MLRIVALLILSVGLLLALGCEEDVLTETKGSVVINPDPDSINAPWSLSGTSSKSGEGDVTLNDMEQGTYTITWDAVAGWTTPASEEKTLTAGKTVTFNGSYTIVAGSSGTIVIDGSPDTIDFPWTLTLPDQSSLDGTDDSTLIEMAVGEYTLTWENLDGWNSPAAETLTLVENQTILFSGEYTIQLPPRTIVIDPLPGYLDAPWTISGQVDSTGTGYLILEDMTVGDYTVTWGDVADWSTPSADTQALSSSDVLTFSSRYVAAADILISADTFDMGSPDTEVDRGPDEEQHSVTLTTDFFMKATEVTQADFLTVMGYNPSPNYLPGSSDVCTSCPVDSVSWYDAIAFCNAKSIRDGFTPAYIGSGSVWTWNQEADGWRLPTEAEWEFACRAGSTTPFNTGDCLATTEACFNGVYPYDTCPTGPGKLSTVAVKFYPANAWGLYDLHGNVWEWCWSYYDTAKDLETNPTADKDFGAVLRGAGWRQGAKDCRSANRLFSGPAYTQNDVGIRIVRSAF